MRSNDNSSGRGPRSTSGGPRSASGGSRSASGGPRSGSGGPRSASGGPRSASGGRPKSPGAGGRPRTGGGFKSRTEGGSRGFGERSEGSEDSRRPRFGSGAEGKREFSAGRRFDNSPGRGPRRDGDKPAGGYRGTRRDAEGGAAGSMRERKGDWGTGGYDDAPKRGADRAAGGFKGPRKDSDSRSGGFRGPRRDGESRSEGFRGPRTEGESRSGGFRGPRKDGETRSEGFRGPRKDGETRSGGFRGPRKDGETRSGGFRGPKRDGETRSEGFRGPRRDSEARTGGFRDNKKSFEKKAPRAPFKKFEDSRPKDEIVKKNPVVDEIEGDFEEREDRIEGRNPVFEALRSGRPLNKLFIEADNDDPMLARITAMAREKDVPVQFLERRKLDIMSQTRIHQGVILEVAAQEYVEVEDILAKAEEQGEKPFIIVLDGITDTNNLGSIIRSAECAGAHGMIIPKRRSASLNATVAKVAAGALEYVPVARVSNLVQTLRELKEKGVWIMGADMEGQSNYYDADLTGPCALVIGSEGEGLSRLTKDECDLLVKIPMKGKISSLNAGVAAALVMFEINKQRNTK